MGIFCESMGPADDEQESVSVADIVIPGVHAKPSCPELASIELSGSSKRHFTDSGSSQPLDVQNISVCSPCLTGDGFTTIAMVGFLLVSVGMNCGWFEIIFGDIGGVG